MTGVAQDRLRLLDEQRVYVIHQLLAERRAFIYRTTKDVRADVQRLAFYFRDATMGGLHDPQHNRYAHQSLATDDCHPDLAVLPSASQEDGHASFDEIDPFSWTVGFLEYLPALELNTPQMGLQSRKYLGWQRLQNAILNAGRLHGDGRNLQTYASKTPPQRRAATLITMTKTTAPVPYSRPQAILIGTFPRRPSFEGIVKSVPWGTKKFPPRPQNGHAGSVIEERVPDSDRTRRAG